MEISVKIYYKNDKLRNLRQSNNMSQSQLANAAGIPVRVLQSYESGARDISGAKLLTLLKLCMALNCKLQDIIPDSETVDMLTTYEKRKEKT